MKKNIITFLAVTFLAISLNSAIIQEQRQANVDLYVEKTQNLINATISYIEKTGDITPTRAEVQEFANLSRSNFTTFSLEECSVNSSGFCTSVGGIGISVTDNRIRLTNVFKNTNNEIKNYYSNSIYLNKNTNIEGSYTYVDYPMSTFGKRVFEEIEEISTDSNKYWYKEYALLPSTGSTSRAYYVGNGIDGIDLYIYTSGSGYKKIFTLNEQNSNTLEATVSFFKNDGFNPDTTLGFKGWKASVQSDDGTKIKEYLHDGDKWVNFSTNAEGGTSNHFEGDTTIVEISTSIFDSEGGSVGVASAPNGEFAGAVDFVKKDNTSTGGYWTDAAKMHIVVQNIPQLKTQSWNLNAKAFYVDETDSKFYYLQRRSISGVGTKWVYMAYGFNDVVNNYDSIDNTEGGYVYDAKNSKYFKKISSTVWRSTDNLVQLTASSSGRSAFTSWNSSADYYTTINDCTSSTCNGSGGAYAGITKDSMYGFVYVSRTAKKKNNLIDAKRRTSIIDIYNNGDLASIYGDYVYVKRNDTLNRTIYYNYSNGYYYSKASAIIPAVLAPRYGTVANLPPNYDAATITFSGNYVIMSSRVYATNWTAAPNGAGARIGSTNYAHIKSGSQDFWTNNGSGDGQASASEIFTRGSRSMFPTVTHSINAMTKIVGTESRYSSSGITSTTDANFKMWFYSTTGTRTRNLLDAVLITDNPYTNSSALSVGVAMKNNKLIIKNGSYWRYGSSYVDKDIVSRSSSHIRAIGASYAGYYATTCSWSNCYTNSTAKSIKYAINTDGKLLTFDGTYWKRSDATTNFVTNHTSSYTTIQKYAIKDSYAYAWSAATELWYTYNSGTRSQASGQTYCSSFGYRLPTRFETSAYLSGGIPSIGKRTWTSTGNYLWYGGSFDTSGHNQYDPWLIRCVK